MSKNTSLKQIAANQNNAQKSTGPNTPEGRTVSKMNALKHGILSREVLVRGLHIKENSRELDALYKRFWQELNPVGPLEEMLVDQIVTSHWRLRRALKAESGETALSVDQGQWQRSQSDLRWEVKLWELSGDPVRAMEQSAIGNSILSNWMREVRALVEQEGELTEAAVKKVQFQEKPTTLSKELEKLRLRFLQSTNGADQATQREENKKQVLAFIDRELGMLKWLRTSCEQREAAEEQARQAAAVLPGPEVLDKILRYEIKLERQQHRAMVQLERLQRMRRGEAVPPPVTVEVSERP